MSPAVRSGFKETQNMVQWKNNWIALAPKVLKGSNDKVPGSNVRAGPSRKVSIFSFRGLEYVGIVKRYCYVYCFAQCMLRRCAGFRFYQGPVAVLSSVGLLRVQDSGKPTQWSNRSNLQGQD